MENLHVSFGFIKEGKIYLGKWGAQDEVLLGEVSSEDPQSSIQFYEKRFADFEEKVNGVIEKIDSNENKGSFLMKLMHLKNQALEPKGLGDYEKVHKKIEEYESLVKETIKKNRERNTAIKTALIEEAKEAVETINWKEGTEKVNELKAKWIKTGNAEAEAQEELETSFWEIVTKYFERKKNFFEDKKKLTDHRKRKYEELVAKSAEAAQLSGPKRFQEIGKLRDEWKNVGGVPSSVYNPLFEVFKSNLKEKKKVEHVDYSMIISSLEQVMDGTISFDKKSLDIIKKNLQQDRSRNKQKKVASELVQLIEEREFINSLAHKRFSNFSKMEKKEKNEIRKKITKDLINRDEEDLKIYEENSANFNTSNNSMYKLVEGRLKNQQRKIEIKNKLMKWFNEKEI